MLWGIVKLGSLPTIPSCRNNHMFVPKVTDEQRKMSPGGLRACGWGAYKQNPKNVSWHWNIMNKHRNMFTSETFGVIPFGNTWPEKSCRSIRNEEFPGCHWSIAKNRRWEYQVNMGVWGIVNHPFNGAFNYYAYKMGPPNLNTSKHHLVIKHRHKPQH